MARKILLADDSVTAQNMGRKILADAGYEVITVNNGSAALKKVSEHRPDLIVLDVYMPGYSGLEVCQRLKEAGDTSRIPILLTVGKLEPFKPEEARRVRADAFIVKPFEASELLSTLSKLEEKVVPRSEPSKPGRFARATAAIDERFDRSMAVEEDSGWKSRIAFPKKKEKEKEKDADVDEGTIYNPVNKDLRTVVEHKPEEHPAAQSSAEDERVNVSALGAEGLPKDVTPEEIAALAAAAAQVKGKIADETVAVDERAAEKAPEATAVKTSEEPAVAAEVPAVKSESTESKEGIPAAEISVHATANVTPDTVPQATEDQKAKEAEVAPSSSEVTAAIAGLEQQAAEESKKSEDVIATEATRVEEPATMAVAAAAAGVGSPRWTAVAVALSSEEASLSLEQEMQQAASFAISAEPERAEIARTSPEADAATMARIEPTTPVAEAPAPTIEASATPAAIEEMPQSQATPSFADARSVSEFVKPEIQDFAVNSPPISEQANEEPTQYINAGPESAATAEVTSSEIRSFEKESGLPAKIEEPIPSEVVRAENSVEVKAAEPEPVDAAMESAAPSEIAKDQPQSETQVAVPEVTAPVASEASDTRSEEAAAEVSAPHSESPIAGGMDEMAKKESEMTATTAAAWASWRKIRETGNGAKNSGDVSELKDEAAKAVAAGAEGSPEEVAALDSDPEIANIVDSVLADMRPKIVEEIAKKLGKKK